MWIRGLWISGLWICGQPIHHSDDASVDPTCARKNPKPGLSTGAVDTLCGAPDASDTVAHRPPGKKRG
jgi:hypothetical protein